MNINGNEYSWADMEIGVSGRTVPLMGVIAHDYTVKQEHKPIHAKGRDPKAMSSGHKNYEGKLTLLQSELEALQQTFPQMKDITDARNFVITTSYIPEDGLGRPVTDQSIDVRFGEVKKGMKTGDGNMEIEIPYTCLKIKYNV